MSNDSAESKQRNDFPKEPLQAENPGQTTAGTSPMGPEKEPWQQIGSDLRSALDSWTEISQRPKAKKKSPEEQQLEDMKRLLANLKSKIREFEGS